MSGPAQVRSTDAIEAFQATIAAFQRRVQAAIDAIDGEMHRTNDWVEHERPAYWRKAMHDAEDAVHEAKMELERCLLYASVDGQRPACREQKAALQAAKVRLEHCREKSERVKHWQRSFRHESLEFDGRLGQLRRLLDHDLPLARGVLAKIMTKLDEYQIERPPAAFEPAAAEAIIAPAASAVRPLRPTSPQDATDAS